AIVTASVVGAERAAAVRTLRQREFSRQTIEPSDGTVTHWPLWYEDPFEDKGSEDGEFKWTAEDAIAFPYGLARFILNTIGLPASMVVEPPWTVMCSDGRLSRQLLGYDHDAERCPGGAVPPIDMLEFGTISGSEPPAENVPDASSTRPAH
ncbi:MAG TPA: hypothetical protein VGM03_09210, partial [Phycisphaerae bacterium]